METYGDLKKTLKNIQLKQKGEKVGKVTIDIILGAIPGLGAAKSTFDVISAAFRKPDTKKSNSWLDKLDIDDEMEAIVDDTVENGFLKLLSKTFDSTSDGKPLEQDFNMNAKMVDYLKKTYKQRTITGISEDKLVFDQFFTKFAYKFDKGYPDMNNDQDVLLLESLISEAVGYKFKLSEKVLNWGDLSSDSRKFIRLTVIDDKIKNGTPFKLEDGREEILTYIDDSYSDLFANQKVVDIKSKLGSKTNTTPLFKDSQGNKISLRDMTKTPDLGGSGKAKVDSSERQEMGLINAINSFPEKPFTLVGANGEKIENVTGARKMPNPKEGEAYTDVVVETTKGDVNISAKGTSSPSIAGGGLKMASNLGPEVENFIDNFYDDAYEYYKEIFDANPELTYDTNLYKTNFFKDVSRAVPQNIMKTVLIGIERFGGPVDGYYIGPMTVESEIKGNELITNGDIISVDKFLKDYPTIYAHIKKRSGDYYFTDKTKPIPANPDIVVPMIFSKKPGGGQAQSRFGMNFKPRNKENII